MAVYASNTFPFSVSSSGYKILGTASSNTTITLSDSLNNYEWVILCGLGGNYLLSSHFIPTSLFSQGETWRLSCYNNQYRTITVRYSSATKVVVSERTTMNFTIVGVKA